MLVNTVLLAISPQPLRFSSFQGVRITTRWKIVRDGCLLQYCRSCQSLSFYFLLALWNIALLLHTSVISPRPRSTDVYKRTGRTCTASFTRNACVPRRKKEGARENLESWLALRSFLLQSRFLLTFSRVVAISRLTVYVYVPLATLRILSVENTPPVLLCRSLFSPFERLKILLSLSSY